MDIALANSRLPHQNPVLIELMEGIIEVNENYVNRVLMIELSDDKLNEIRKKKVENAHFSELAFRQAVHALRSGNYDEASNAFNKSIENTDVTVDIDFNQYCGFSTPDLNS